MLFYQRNIPFVCSHTLTCWSFVTSHNINVVSPSVHSLFISSCVFVPSCSETYHQISIIQLHVSGMIIVRKQNNWKSMKNNWNHLYPLSNDLFWLCPATFNNFSPEENSWNQLNNWKKSCLISFPPVAGMTLWFLCMSAHSDGQHCVLSFVFTFCVSFNGVRCNFHIKTMFISSLPTVVCRRVHVHVLFTLFVFAYSGVHTYWLDE